MNKVNKFNILIFDKSISNCYYILGVFLFYMGYFLMGAKKKKKWIKRLIILGVVVVVAVICVIVAPSK